MENVLLDFASDVPLNEQDVKNRAFVNDHCAAFLEDAMADRQARVEKARVDHFARLDAEEEVRRLREEEEERKLLAVSLCLGRCCVWIVAADRLQLLLC
jgi:hypothetical protein